MGPGTRRLQLPGALAEGHGASILHGGQPRAAVHRTMQHHNVLLRQRVASAQSPSKDQDRQQQRQYKVVALTSYKNKKLS